MASGRDPKRPRSAWYKRKSYRIALAAAVAAAGIVTASLLVPAPSVWGPPQVLDRSGGGGLQSLSCASASFCAAFDGAGRLFLFDSGRWHETGTDLARGNQVPTDISCVAPDFCLVGSYSGDVLEFNGKSVRKVRIDRNESVDSISCASRAFCGAVAGPDAFIYDRGKWSRLTPVSRRGGASLATISCVAPSFCAIGGIATFQASSRTTGRLNFPGGPGPDQLACSSPESCVGITDLGRWFQLRQGAWRFMGDFPGADQTQGYTPKMLSCPTATRCFEAATSGVIYELNHGRWTSLGYLYRQSWARRLLEMIVPTPAVSISCPSLDFCEAVDGYGNAYAWSPAGR